MNETQQIESNRADSNRWMSAFSTLHTSGMTHEPCPWGTPSHLIIHCSSLQGGSGGFISPSRCPGSLWGGLQKELRPAAGNVTSMTKNIVPLWFVVGNVFGDFFTLQHYFQKSLKSKFGFRGRDRREIMLLSKYWVSTDPYCVSCGIVSWSFCSTSLLLGFYACSITVCLCSAGHKT